MAGSELSDRFKVRYIYRHFQYQQSLGALGCHRPERSLKIRNRPAHPDPQGLQTKGACRSIVYLFERIPPVRGAGDILVTQNCDTDKLRIELLQHFELFSGLLGVKACDSRNVSTWPLQRVGVSKGDWIEYR